MNDFHSIAILDFGSQYTQLIARKIREQKVYCKILPYNINLNDLKSENVKGIILSGGPNSIYEKKALKTSSDLFKSNYPILGICYGMHLIIHEFGGKVEKLKNREYGKTKLFIDSESKILDQVENNLIVWMSHQDSILKLPNSFKKIAHTNNSPYAIIEKDNIFGIQFHPELSYKDSCQKILTNFLFKICKIESKWTMHSFIKRSIKSIKKQVGNQKVICALSGGVDSSVTALLLKKAIGNQLSCIFVDNGLLRYKEKELLHNFFEKNLKINLQIINAEDRFLNKLKGINDPEKKRKIIGKEFISIFEEEALKQGKINILAQGTIYPDIIESESLNNKSVKIKSHHNVGGLPEKMNLNLIEPLKELFKDEVRILGKELKLIDEILYRHPFPGPGLAIRIIGEVTKKRIKILQLADHIAMNELKKEKLHDKIWQAFIILIPVKTVGVMGDCRTYENVAALRCVDSIDGMTANSYPIPHEILTKIATNIVNRVEGINRVVYDITSKPPATIEWE